MCFSSRRLIDAKEGERMGLINVLVDSSSSEEVFSASLNLANTLSRHPQQCMKGDRLSSLSLPTSHGEKGRLGRWNVQGEERRAMQLEFEHGLHSLAHLGKELEDFLQKRVPKASL